MHISTCRPRAPPRCLRPFRSARATVSSRWTSRNGAERLPPPAVRDKCAGIRASESSFDLWQPCIASLISLLAAYPVCVRSNETISLFLTCSPLTASSSASNVAAAGSVKLESEDAGSEPGTAVEDEVEEEGVQEDDDQHAGDPGLGRDALLGRLNAATEENSAYTYFHRIFVSGHVL